MYIHTSYIGNEADYTDGDYRIAVDPEQSNTPDGHPPSPAKFIRYPRIGTPQETTTPFHFAIGSVESFERKLEEAQKNLGISPRDFIPVVYADDADWAKEAMSLAPTLIFVGLYFAVMRGIGRGGMGGGAGGLFNIGKSNAKKINKEMVTTSFKDVAGIFFDTYIHSYIFVLIHIYVYIYIYIYMYINT